MPALRPKINKPPDGALKHPFRRSLSVCLLGMSVHFVNVGQFLWVFRSLWRCVPGHSYVTAYVKSCYKHDPYRTVIECLLFAYALYVFTKKHRSGRSAETLLTEREVDELVEEWHPEPLAPECEARLAEAVTVVGAHGVSVSVRNLQGGGVEQLLNASSHDVLGISCDKSLVAAAKDTLRKYGVGTCGPRGFYGTLDVHLELEQRIASFLGCEAAIIYSQAFSAVSSAIPAFAKRGDIIVVDDACGDAVMRGVEISRSQVHRFRHNDMADLQALLLRIDSEQQGKPLCRRFLVSEGLFKADCSLAPLPELIRAKEKHRYRLIFDETLSIGCLGDSGRGACEHWGVSAAKVDVLIGSMAHALGAGGGFVAGSAQVVDHQRLSSQAYCFSASLPAILATTCLRVLDMLQKPGSAAVGRLHQNIGAFNALLAERQVRSTAGHEESPLRYFCVAPSREETEAAILRARSKHRVLLSSVAEGTLVKVAVSAAHSAEDLVRIADSLLAEA